MVQFKSLYVDPENRPIRAIVDTPTGAVTIFEPTQENVAAIMSLQDMVTAFNQENDGENTLEISGNTIMRELIPRLTDIELDPDMTDEEMAKIIANPTVELNCIIQYLSSIVTNIYKLMILNFKAELELQSLLDLNEETNDQSVAAYVQKAAKTDEGREGLRNIQKASAAYLKSVEGNSEGTEAEEETQAESAPVNVDESSEDLDPESYQKGLKDQLDKFNGL